MKRNLLVCLVVAVAVSLSVVATSVASVGIDNGDFESSAAPRAGHQGWEDEYIFGWKAFSSAAWMPNAAEHVAVVEDPNAPGRHILKLVGMEGTYVGLRSVHVPVEMNKIYTASAKAMVKEMADPSRMQVWLEFWPEKPAAETAANRLKYSRATVGSLGKWEDLVVSDQAPPDAATATVLIIIHKSGKAPLMPAEAYVDDVRLMPAE